MEDNDDDDDDEMGDDLETGLLATVNWFPKIKLVSRQHLTKRVRLDYNIQNELKTYYCVQKLLQGDPCFWYWRKAKNFSVKIDWMIYWIMS
jgi:hypothetical protein